MKCVGKGTICRCWTSFCYIMKQCSFHLAQGNVKCFHDKMLDFMVMTKFSYEHVQMLGCFRRIQASFPKKTSRLLGFGSQ